MATPRDFLFSLEPLGIKLGLAPIRALLDVLGFPDRAYRSVIVAGTNGKGSVTAMLERGLRAAGYRTGRYTSPHLVHLEERFAIDGRDVTPSALDAALADVQHAAASLPAPLSFFEATTGAAAQLFRAEQVDIALFEVGLGGRLDATNAVSPIAAVITAIDFDHQQFLGTTIEAIAGEKAGVIKPGIVCVMGNNPPEAASVIATRCDDVSAVLVRANDDLSLDAVVVDGRTVLNLRTPVASYPQLALGLRGRHQIDNAVTAVRALEQLREYASLDVDAAAIRTAVEDVVWPGRLEFIQVEGQRVLLDGAHNAAGARALAAYLTETYPAGLPLVLGVLRDKDVDAIAAPLAAIASHVICTAPRSDRALAPADLAAVVARVAPNVAVSTCAEPAAALRVAAPFGSPVVVAGSLYLAGEIRANIS